MFVFQQANDIPIEVTLNDPDGSESYVLLIDEASVPNGTVLTGVGGPITPSGGFYTVTAADLDPVTGVFTLTPPQDWSSANPSQGDIVLETQTIVTDSPDVGIAFNLTIVVDVEGDADKPPTRTITVVGDEDEFYDLGSVITPQLPGVLVDVSGLELT